MRVTSKTHPNYDLLFMIARDFVQLDFNQKLAVGVELKLVSGFDALLSNNALEDIIFEQVVKKDLIKELTVAINRVKV